jgi:pyrroloquinoline quinone (PQQ) biosynthesis protein C
MKWMGKRGRKSGFSEALQSRIVALVEEGKTLEQVGEVVGVSRQTIYNWLGQHKDLLYAVREARQVADELVEAALFSRALGYSHPEEKLFAHEGLVVDRQSVTKHYPPDTTAAMFWLRNRQPDRWKEKTEGDVNVNQTVNVGTMTDGELDAKLAALMAKAAPKTTEGEQS